MCALPVSLVCSKVLSKAIKFYNIALGMMTMEAMAARLLGRVSEFDPKLENWEHAVNGDTGTFPRC